MRWLVRGSQLYGVMLFHDPWQPWPTVSCPCHIDVQHEEWQFQTGALV